MFEIFGLVERIGCAATGHTLQVCSVIKYMNDRGDTDYTEVVYDIDGIVQVVTSGEDEVKEGILMPNDLICFFDENAANNSYLLKENHLKYDSLKYKITNVIRELGHIEVLAQKM